MKVQIQESKKEKLPLDFITTFVGKLWDEIGILQAQMDAIKSTYSGTSEINPILQDLLDSYIICVGRLQNQLSDKKYIDMPDDKELALTEAIDFKPEPFEEPVENTQDSDSKKLSNCDIDVEQTDDSIKIEITPNDMDSFEDIDFNVLDVDDKQAKTETPKISEPFEYFVEFDEPDITEEDRERISDWQRR